MKRFLLVLAFAAWSSTASAQFALRQSTASQEVPIGIVVDSADGNSEETSLTISNTDIWLWADGATTIANKNSGGATHIQNGIYYAVLDATDTATVGNLVILVHEAGSLPERINCFVYPANVYDAMKGTDKIEVDVAQYGGTNGTFSGGRPEVNTTHAAGTAWGSGAITAASIASDAITAAKIAADAITSSEIADNAIDAGAIATDAITAAKIAADAIGASELAASAIGSSELATGAITSATFAANAIAAAATASDFIAEVNAEVVDALNTDTYAEPGQGTPAATASLATKINYVYKAFRNKKTQTATTFSLFNDDASTVDHKATTSDDGTTTTVGEVTTGP